mgnify:CR=1 FL=1
MWVGTSLSDKLITKTNILKTLPLQTGFRSKFYPLQSDFVYNIDFYDDLNKIIKNHKIKGLFSLLWRINRNSKIKGLKLNNQNYGIYLEKALVLN